MARRSTIEAFASMFILGFAAAARAQSGAAPTEAAEAEPAEGQPGEATEAPAAAEGAALMRPVNPPQFGLAFQSRWISLPSAFLGLFTKANRPLSSYGVGLEGFRRTRDAGNPNRFWELALGVGYQNMSPPDGNWLGNNHPADIDTDWVQFKNFGFWTIDFSFIQRQYFNEVFGIHYGAGLGLTIIQGDILRTSSYGPWDPAANNGAGGFDIPCTDKNLSACRPNVCAGGVCTEAELKSTQSGAADSADFPHRFREGSVPGAIPALTLLFGLDFRIPQSKGLEFRIDAGLFDLMVIFLGGGIAYVF
jgi:hypothetical protein